MKRFKLEITLQEQSIEELTETDRTLRDAAIQAAHKAYAVYSHFQVGAAALLANGEVVTGNNQENAAYPSGCCAERVALFYAGAQYPEIPVVSLAIVAISKGEIRSQISPCGACRQVLLETEQRYQAPLRVLLCGKDKVTTFSSAADLLPLCFGESDLKA